nr:MAG TPA: hypothetical protein [Caudoviricetes sp.]
MTHTKKALPIHRGRVTLTQKRKFNLTKSINP